MHMIIICPDCGNAFEITCAIKVKTRVRISTDKAVETKKIEEINVRDIRTLSPEELRILKKIKPYLKPGLTKASLVDILMNKLDVKKSKVRHMASIIKKAYGTIINGSAGGDTKSVKGSAHY